MQSPFVLLEVKNSRESEETPAAMEQVCAALGAMASHGGFFSSIFRQKHAPKYFSFELVSVNARLHFFIGIPSHLQSYVESQLTAQYPKILLSQSPDYISHFFTLPHASAHFTFSNSFFDPLKTYKDVKELDVLASVLGQMAKLPSGEAAAVQIWISPAGHGWQHTASSVVARGVPDVSSPTPGRMRAHPHARLIETKIAQVGFESAIRIATVAATEHRATELLQSLGGTFGVYTLGEGNSLQITEPAFWNKKRLEKAMIERNGDLRPKNQILNASELASLWHPPGLTLSMIKNISWGSQLTGKAPENLLISDRKSVV